MNEQLLKAFRILDSNATANDMRDACKNLFICSVEYMLADHPFNSAEVDAVANAIYESIVNPDNSSHGKIVFSIHRSLEGKAIGYDDYAARFSEDMLYQNFSSSFESLEPVALRIALKTFLVGILYRYSWCILENWFPVSAILNYMDAVAILLRKEQREGELYNALLTTLAALRSLEPFSRLGEAAAEEAARFMASRRATQ